MHKFNAFIALMDIDDINLLDEVVRAGGFTAVARVRQIDPSLVSRAVQSIEADLGVRLFHRTTRSVTPTEACRIFLQHAGSIPGELEAARQAALGVAMQPAGQLRMTASIGFSQMCLVPLLPAFCRVYPDLKLNLISSDAVLDLSAEGIDLAIRLAPSLAGDYVASKLFAVRYRVVATPNFLNTHTLRRPADLANVPCVSFSLPAYRARWLFRPAGGEDETVEINPKIEATSSLALRDLALAGVGAALLPEWCIGADIARGDLIDPFDDYGVTATDFEAAVWIAYPSREYLPIKTRVAIDFFKRNLSLGEKLIDY